MSENFLKAVQAADLADGQSIPVELNGWPVLVCRNEGQIYAVINRCTHASATLEEGRIRKGSVICPLHGARFELASGKCLGGAPYRPLKTFEARETAEGWIEVAVPEEGPGAEHMPVIRAGV